MSPFESYQSYRMFERDVREKSRFIQSDQTKQFLSAINDSLESRVYVLQKNRIVWRAQVGCDWAPVYCEEDHVTDEPAPFKAERMKPLKREAAEGRANPTGIPLLYSASDRATAVAEVRPWLGAHVSVAQLRISKELRLINCFRNHGKRNSVVYLDGEPSEDVRMDSVWTDIDNAFAEPVTPNDRVAGYIPTQILAELFRNRGFDRATPFL